ncbi:acriflavin resistance protein [Alkalilimnicola ehrlichii]|uniref:Acriflavin resistance protein n=1 Tax=Alkalilimnicola ehrlichii TaxID=351052 RepID=A0A3E0X3G8_9GAMM|nr:efflux RND transporter permease subunit [Alkalilimnicola ehrlichii]RFA30917.1 acriflavin resistance protein [Alkalilimnicola ehrlichii]RFA38867.1 acriflavin resistance protein [Alkalilimnicola ehrlichii]
MSLPELSIKRPVLAFMLSAVLLLFGYISFERVGVDRFPAIEFPVISVLTLVPGANPEIIDTSVTSTLENSINSIPGIDRITSSSSPGASLVIITFDLDTDIDAAFLDVQAKVNEVANQLPDDAETPTIAKVETNAQPIMWLTLQGDRTLQQLDQYARNDIAKRLETIPGVGEVRVGGGRERTIRVELAPERMAAYGLTAQDLMHAFQNEHIQLPGGFLVGNDREHMIKLDLEFHSTRELEQMVVSYRDGSPVRLHDVADVVDGLADYRSDARFNGQPAVGLGIVKIANANTVEIIEEVKRRLDSEIRPQLPPGMAVHIAFDSSSFILEMIRALEEHLVLGTLLAAFIVWLFLKSFRSTAIIATAIPVSLFGAIAAMYMFGYTMNTVTLLALLLLVGIVVDDAIVVLENIYRHREEGEQDPQVAAINGTRQVVFPVLASTLTLVAIFAPVIFLGGIIGMFFASFGVVVTVGVLVSWFVAMTLTPMLASRYLKVEQHEGPVAGFLERSFRRLERGYRHLVEFALRYRWGVVGAATLIVLSSGFFFAQTGKTFLPDDDEGIFVITARTPLGSSVEYTNGRMQRLEAIVAQQPEVENYFSTVGGGRGSRSGTEGQIFVRLVPREQRRANQQAVMQRVREEMAQVPGVKASPASMSLVAGGRGEPLQFVLSGPELEELSRHAETLRSRLNSDPRLGNIDLDLQLDLPQVELRIDRERAAALGLSTRDIANTVYVLAGGANIAKFNDLPGDGNRYDIRLKARDGEFRHSDDLGRLYLRNRNGDLVRLDSVVTLEETLGPAVIGRHSLQYGATFFGTPNVPLAEAMELVREEAEALLPQGYGIRFIGQAEEFAKTAAYISFAFVLATVLVYMVLASQFNSFIQPLIIMVAQPLAMIGGVAALWLTGHTLNIFSMIGLVLLVGLVAKNSILLVDMANQLRAAGRGIDEALREACPIRLRPVLMTSLTVILALLPAATGLGAGADTNGPLAVAVIGGMVTSTLLTLVVVPAVYSLTENGIERLRNRATADARNDEESPDDETAPDTQDPGAGGNIIEPARSGRKYRPADSVPLSKRA